MCVWILTVAIAFGVGTIPQTASAKGEVQANDETKPVQHRIVQIKDLIEDFDESEWTAVTENGGKFGANIGGVERAKKGQVTGYFTSGQQYVDCKGLARNVIEINSKSIGNENVQEIRGSYTMTLPLFKRIQLEIKYELPYEEGKSNFDDYYIDVSERNKLNQDEWIKLGTLKQNEELKSDKLNLYNKSDSKFSFHSYVANLSEWSGREIRLDFVTKMSPDANSEKQVNGRWINLRLVGSTFDYKFIDRKDTQITEQFNHTTNQVKSNSIKTQSKNRLQYDETVTSSSDFRITNLDCYPDTGPAPVYINDRWVAYFNSDYWGRTIVNGEAHGGSLVFDLMNFTPFNLYSIYFDMYYQYCLLRGNPPTPSNNAVIEPYPAIAPYRPANPTTPPLHWKEYWANGYTGVNSAYVASNRVHAFLHVEDWFMDPNAPNFLTSPTAGINWYYDINGNLNTFFYARIGYARSPLNQAYPLQLTRCANDESSPNINNASPIIECFQKECQIQRPEDHDGLCGLTGTQGPAVISSNGYIYLFYTRYVANSWLFTYVPPEYPAEQGTWISKGILTDDELINIGLGDLGIGTQGVPYTLAHSVCVARAPEITINSESYSTENLTSPWKKYYDGEWSYVDNRNAGIGGLSTPVVVDLPNPGWNNRIVSNVLYNTYLSQFMMLTWDDRDNCTYLYLCQDLSNPDWGTGLCVDDLPSDEIGTRLIGNTGDDKLGANYMALITRDDDDVDYATFMKKTLDIVNTII